jgi:hypothetical protein
MIQTQISRDLPTKTRTHTNNLIISAPIRLLLFLKHRRTRFIHKSYQCPVSVLVRIGTKELRIINVQVTKSNLRAISAGVGFEWHDCEGGHMLVV